MILIDHRTVEAEVSALIAPGTSYTRPRALREIEVCYYHDFGSDPSFVTEASGLTPGRLVEAHLALTLHVLVGDLHVDNLGRDRDDPYDA